MSKMLQKNAGPDRRAHATVQPTQLILDRKFAIEVVSLIKAAKSEILVCAYAWRWYKNDPSWQIQLLNMELMKANVRGVRVRCLLNNQTMYDQFRDLGFVCKYVGPIRTLHTKAIVVDNTSLVLGSHNLTKRATNQNFEATVVLHEYEVIEQFKTYFEKIWEVAYAG